MKISVIKNELKDAINISSRFVTTKQQLPILGNIYLKAEKNRLFINATNLESSIITSIGAKTTEEGEITVLGKTINEVVSSLPDDNLDISVEKEQMQISGNKNKTMLVGSNSAEFPKVKVDGDKSLCSLKLSKFNSMIQKVLFSVSHDETRPSLTGVLFKFSKNKLTLVSTDGFRLTQIKSAIDYSGEDFSLIVPRFVLSEVSKILGEDVLVKYDTESKLILFVVGETVIVSRLIEGNFPDYEKIIPTKFVLDFEVDKIDFERSVKSASVFSRDTSNIVKLKIENDSLIVSAESSSSGNQESILDIKKGENKIDVELLFNYRFIEDLTKNIEDDFVSFFVSGSVTACLFLDKKDPDFLHLIMPIKTS